MAAPPSPTRPRPTAEEIVASLPPGELWEDPAFPADSRSLFPSREQQSSYMHDVRWKRAKEFRPNAKFISKGASRFDIDQGQLGNCWFVAAVATLSNNKKLFERVVPLDQSFGDDHKGLFRFRFWVFGAWEEVVVDDRLPVFWNNSRLYFCHNKEDPDEFWPALLEKAYAKLHGSYEAMAGGKIQDALVDLTGGVGEVIDLTQKKNTPRNFFRHLRGLMKRNTLMGCSISTFGKTEMRIENRLRTNHAYSITGVDKISLKGGGGKTRLIRLLNPWGRGDHEYTGRYSDGSPDWENVTAESKKAIEYSNTGDGEFWMEFDAWKSTFTEVQLCHIAVESANTERPPWYLESVHGEWSCTSGCEDCSQYMLGIEHACGNEVVDHSAAEEEEEDATVVVSLMQKVRGAERPQAIAYTLSKVVEGSEHVVPLPPDSKTTVGEAHSKYREVSHTHHVTPGVYSLEVTSKQTGQYFLRLVTDRKVDLKM